MGEVFDKISKKLDRFRSVEARTAFLTKLVGLENIKTIEGLVLRRKELDSMTATLTGTSVATEQATLRMSSFLTALAQVGTAIEEKIIKLDGPLKNVLGSIPILVRGFIDSFSKDELLGINALLSSMAGILGTLGAAFMGIVKIIARALSNLTKLGKLGALLFAKFSFGDAIDFEKELKAINFGELVANLDIGLGGLVGNEANDKAMMHILGGVKTEVDININDPGNQVKSAETKTTPLAPRGASFKQGSNMVAAT